MPNSPACACTAQKHNRKAGNEKLFLHHIVYRKQDKVFLQRLQFVIS